MLSRNFVTPWHPMQQISGAAFRKRSLHPLAGVTVLQILAELGTSPAARAAIEIAEALVQVGGTPLVAARGGSSVSELQARGGIFIRLPTQSINPIDPALALGRLVGLIRTEAIDIVHARSRLSASIAFAAARLTRTAFVTTFPSSIETSNGLAARFSSIMARGDRVLVDGAYAARIAETLHPAAIGKTHVIGPGIDHAAFAPDRIPTARVRDLRQGWNSPPDEPVVVFLAELDLREAQAFLGATARILRARGHRGPRLVHIGHGPNARCCTLDPAAESLRALPPCEDLPAALRAASVVAALTGRAEAICRLAVGAQAMGTPVIVADGGALGETVLAPPDAPESLRTGWRIPNGEPAALAAAIEAGLGLGASARERLWLRARAHVDRHLSTESMRAETLRAFAALRDGEDDV
jgi:glycosyltransferase involved in cell wall biosynthesis